MALNFLRWLGLLPVPPEGMRETFCLERTFLASYPAPAGPPENTCLTTKSSGPADLQCIPPWAASQLLKLEGSVSGQGEQVGFAQCS